MAWAARFKKETQRYFVLMGDGECNEGAVWEAAMSAAQFRLSNLTAIVDANGFQSDGATDHVIDSRLLPDKFNSFGWDVRVVNGHDPKQLFHELSAENQTKVPRAIIAKTIKGKGFSFMESNNTWHHNRLTQNSFDLAMSELTEVHG
jgi:transketolase